jgi:ceramide glucosyltransferase
MVSHVFELVCIVSLLIAFLLQRFQLRALARPLLEPSAALPPVSILKPLKGVDAELASNLKSFFVLDYPHYELVFGVQDATDPAVDVARQVAAEFPEVAVRFVVDGRRVGFNPKVNNLANILRGSRHELILISDSNVAVGPDYLRHMVAQLQRPGVGLVTSFIRGTGGRGFGALLEGVQLNTFVMGGVAAAAAVGRVAAVGKSMLMRRADLERIGGFRELGRYLAEDQVCGEVMGEAGLEVVVSPSPVDNVLGALSVSDFADRHLRWARIRRHIAPLSYAGEMLSNPIPWAVLAWAVNPGLRSLLLGLSVLVVMSGLALISERRLGLQRKLAGYPLVEALRGVLVSLLWVIPFFSSTVAWRGREFRIGRRTLLRPVDEESTVDWLEPEDGPPEEVLA